MDKKLYGSIITILILLSCLWVFAAYGSTITITSPYSYQNISANSTASNQTTVNFSMTIPSNTADVSNITVDTSTNNATWTAVCSFTNSTAGFNLTFSKLCNATLAEGRHYFNFTTWKFKNGSLDNATGYNDTKIVTTWIDRTAPTVEELFPANYTNSTTGSVTFYYNVTDSGSNVSNCTLFLQKAGVWEANASTIDTAIEEAENQSFSITGLSDGGGYLWLVSCEDHTGNEGNSSYFNISVDTVNPGVKITIENENRIRYIANPIKIKCSVSDAVAGIDYTTTKLTVTKPSGRTVEISLTGAERTPWTHEFKGAETNEAGLYKVDCTVKDRFDNTGFATQKSFRILHEDVGLAEGDVPTEPIADVDVSTATEPTGTIGGKQGESKTFTLDGTTTHTIEFIEVGITSATLRISSDPIEIILDVGQYKNVDVDSDGTNDIKITLNSIDDGLAKIEVINLVKLEEQRTGVVAGAEEPGAETESKAGLWITILVILVIIIVGYFVLTKKKGKKGEVKFSRKDLGI